MIKRVELKLRRDKFYLLELKDSYKEFYRFRHYGGGELFSEFMVQLEPSNYDMINVTIEAEDEWEITVIEKGILSGVKAIIKVLDYYEIGFSGFSIYLKAGRFHPIDSKPIGYEFPIKGILLRLIQENIFSKSVKIYSTSNKLFKLDSIEKGRESKYLKGDVVIRLPLKHKKSILIKDDWKGRGIYGGAEGDDREGIIDVKIENNYKEFKPNKLAIKFMNDIPISLGNLLVKQLEFFVRFVYDQKLNLGGLTIKVELINNWEKHDYRHVELEPLLWILKTILFKKENIMIKEESMFKV